MSKTMMLKELIQGYLESGKNRTQIRLAESCAISPKTIQRIMNEECEPTINTVMTIAGCILKDRGKVLNFMAEYSPEHFQRVKDFYANAGANLSETESGPVVMQMKDDPTFYLVGVLLTNDKGVSKDCIVNNAGYAGLAILKQLISDGLAFEISEGKFRLKENNIGAYDAPTIKAHVNQALNRYNPRNFGADIETIMHLVRWVNEEGRKQIRNVLMEAAEQVERIAKKLPGDIAVATFSGNVTLTTDEKGVHQ